MDQLSNKALNALLKEARKSPTFRAMDAGYFAGLNGEGQKNNPFLGTGDVNSLGWWWEEGWREGQRHRKTLGLSQS